MKPKRQTSRQYKVPVSIERERQKELGFYEVKDDMRCGPEPYHPFREGKWEKNDVRLPVHTFDDELDAE